jgi:hypothetical protein
VNARVSITSFADSFRATSSRTPTQRMLMIPQKILRRTDWSRRALTGMVISFIACILLAVGDGFAADAWMAAPHDHRLTILRTLITDFRYLAEQIIYASTVLFIGAKFFEQRTVISIGFDKPDAGKMAVMGPDENGFIWVGRKYASRIEGESAVSELKTRIMQSSEKNFGEFGW